VSSHKVTDYHRLEEGGAGCGTVARKATRTSTVRRAGSSSAESDSSAVTIGSSRLLARSAITPSSTSIRPHRLHVDTEAMKLFLGAATNTFPPTDRAATACHTPANRSEHEKRHMLKLVGCSSSWRATATASTSCFSLERRRRGCRRTLAETPPPARVQLAQTGALA
jgi:hypothetical protein